MKKTIKFTTALLLALCMLLPFATPALAAVDPALSLVYAGLYSNISPSNTSKDAAYEIDVHKQTYEQHVNGNMPNGCVIQDSFTSSRPLERWYKIYLTPTNITTNPNILTVWTNATSVTPVKFSLYNSTSSILLQESNFSTTTNLSFTGFTSQFGQPVRLNITTAGWYYIEITTSAAPSTINFTFRIGDPAMLASTYRFTASQALTISSTTNTTVSASYLIDKPMAGIDNKYTPIVYRILSSGTRVNSLTGEQRFLWVPLDSTKFNAGTMSSTQTINVPFASNRTLHGTWKYEMTGRVTNATRPFSFTPNLTISFIYQIIP